MEDGQLNSFITGVSTLCLNLILIHMQKIITLLITAAIIYMLFQHNIGNIKAPLKPAPSETRVDSVQEQEIGNKDNEPAGNFIEKTLSNVLINILKTDQGRMFFENIIQPMNGPMAASGQGFKINNDHLVEAMFDIKTFGDGQEGPASCGHVVTVSYKILTPDNMIISEGTKSYPLGSEEIATGVDAVIVGMKTGQTRTALISSKYTDIGTARSADNKVDSFKLNVTLKSIMPQNFVIEKVNATIFDDEIAYKLPLLCGRKAVYHARVTRLSNGKVLYDSGARDQGHAQEKERAKINMRIGSLNYPLIFSHALHNKIPTGTRTVIAKGQLFKSFVNDFSVIFPDTKLPENEFFMLELYDFENNLTNNSRNLPIQKP